MEIQVKTKKMDDAILLTVMEPNLNHENAASLKEKLFLEIADGNSKIILDLANVERMDSSGLGALLFGKRQANNAGGDLVLVSAQPAVVDMIRIAQLSRVFELFPTTAEALSFWQNQEPFQK